MSLDAEYILDYECFSYVDPSPMSIDKKFLEDKYGGKVVYVQEHILYWEKPKYLLLDEDFKLLIADRIFEKIDCGLLTQRK